MTGSTESHGLAEPGGMPEPSRKQQSFQEFIAQHHSEFMRHAMSRLRNLHDADEAVQIAAVKMHTKWTVIEAHANPLALAMEIVRTSVIDYYRRLARLADREIPLAGSGLPRTPSADDLLELRGYDRLDKARTFLEERAPKQAECVRLRFLEDKTIAEIADYLNITTNATTTNIHLGLTPHAAPLALVGTLEGTGTSVVGGCGNHLPMSSRREEATRVKHPAAPTASKWCRRRGKGEGGG